MIIRGIMRNACLRMPNWMSGWTKSSIGRNLDLQNITASKLKQADVLMSTGVIENPEAPLSEQRYVMKYLPQESGTLLPTLGITFEY